MQYEVEDILILHSLFFQALTGLDICHLGKIEDESGCGDGSKTDPKPKEESAETTTDTKKKLAFSISDKSFLTTYAIRQKVGSCCSLV